MMATTGQEVVKTTLTPVIPAEVHGFAVTVGLGPYPPGDPKPGRRAVYAELLPVSEKAQSAMRHMNRKRILGMVPVTPEAAADMQADPQGRLAEVVSTYALAEASRLARTIDNI